ncbi:MAG TPA: hypothetical protein VNH44_02800 [Micropepsaceae bacterium]|nr:hypothetical protein [Micropepsaceae bacterium]
MTLDGFLAFLTLAVAIYALISPVAKLRALIALPFQIPLAILGFILVLYFEFFPALKEPCPSELGRACEWLVFPADQSFTPAQAAFVVVLVWMVLALVAHLMARPGTRSLTAMAALIDTLVYEQRFAELVKLFEPYLAMVSRAAQRKLPLQRLHDRLAKFDDTKDRQRSARKYLRAAMVGLAFIVPAQRKAEEAGLNIVRVLYRSADFRRFITQMRPYFALSLLRLDLFAKYDFADAYFADLIADTGSVLYQELEQHQNASGLYFPESNRLLHFLFADVRVAEDLAVYKPVAGYLFNILRTDESAEYTTYLNKRSDSFDVECWQDPTFAVISFFDLMVSAAAHQGVRWHMWLYHFPSIVARLEELYDSSGLTIDTSDEFPTRAARLIYETFRVQGNWIRLVKNLPRESPHRSIEPGLHGDNSNIPMSAALALGSSMAIVAMSARIGDSFVAYLHETIMRDINDLNREGDEGRLRSFLIHSIVNGGQHNPGHCYGMRLRSLLGNADHFLRQELEDYEAALEAAYPGIALGS